MVIILCRINEVACVEFRVESIMQSIIVLQISIILSAMFTLTIIWDLEFMVILLQYAT